MICRFHRILEQGLFADYDVISQNAAKNPKNALQKIFSKSFVHIEHTILELLNMFYF